MDHTAPTPARRSPLRCALAVVALLAAACGASGEEAAPATSTTPAAAAPADFPVTVTGANGPVPVATRPARIVSLSASLTEMLFAIGAGDQVVAVDRYSDHPPGTPMTDLSGFQPNVEAIAGYDPDLVVASSDRDGLAAALGAVGVPTVVLTSAATLADVEDQIATLATATGHRAEAAELVAGMRAELDAIVEGVPDRPEPLRYYYELSDSYHTVTSQTFLGEVLALAGLRSIADDAADAAGGYPQLSAEAVVAADPDVILVARSEEDVTAADVAGRPGWSSMAAVAEGRVVVLSDDLSNRWGPRIVDLLREVVDATADR